MKKQKADVVLKEEEIREIEHQIVKVRAPSIKSLKLKLEINGD